jgi:hypothetical protein
LLVFIVPSLSAARIRNSLLKTQVYGLAAPTDFVYKFPTISKMAAFVYGFSLVTQAVSANKSDEYVPAIPDGDGTIVRFHEAPKGEVPLIMLHGT